MSRWTRLEVAIGKEGGIDSPVSPTAANMRWLAILSRVARIRLEHFTGFDALDLQPSSGINVLVGANGTGKTHSYRHEKTGEYDGNHC